MQLKLTLCFPLAGPLSYPSVPPITNALITGTSFYMTLASPSLLKDYRECLLPLSLVDKFYLTFFFFFWKFIVVVISLT